jgi:myosin heavy subunit
MVRWVYTYRYIVTGFIDKNKDPIYQDFMRLLYNR